MGRDIVSEITSIKGRRSLILPFRDVTLRIHALGDAIKSQKQLSTEFLRYIPIAAIGIVEGFFRIAIKELVDSKPEYATNAEKYKDLKFDFRVISALHSRSLTAGELLSHLLACSSFENLNTHLSQIIGNDFTHLISTFYDRWEVEIKKQPKVPILSDTGKIFQSLRRLFELRHIYCHELAAEHFPSESEVLACWEDTKRFLETADSLIYELIDPGHPLTQMDINQRYGEQMMDAESILETKLEELEKTTPDIPECKEAFVKLKADWENFRDSWGELDASGYKGGSMQPMVRYESLKKVIKSFQALIQDHLDHHFEM